MLWLLSLLAHAQSTTGMLVGEVTGTDNEPLAEVTVVLSSSVLRGDVMIETDEKGRYVLPALPPGTYEIVFDAPGMRERHFVNLTVNTNRTTHHDVTLRAYVPRHIPLIEEEPVIDFSTADHGTTLDQEVLQRLPIR